MAQLNTLINTVSMIILNLAIVPLSIAQASLLQLFQ